MIYQLVNADQSATLMKTVWPKVKSALEAGKQLQMEIKAVSKSRDQEKLYHELIGQIAKQAQHLGARWELEDWKRLLVQEFCKESGLSTGKVIPSLDGSSIVQLGLQTRKFTKEQANEFIDWIYAWGSANGVTFE